MDQQKWPLIKQLFNQAQSLPDAEQAEFVNRNCEGDTEVAESVLKMLRADKTQQSDPNLTSIVAATASDLLVDDSVLRTGDIIDHFKVVGAIGNGGMGSVFLAERIDDDFEQLVAIKVIHHKLIASQSVQRFRRERQILASLNHKYIASFIGGGETEQGLPYIILEYVDGMSITQYCQHHNLDISQRIELFKQVVEAVIYAHQNLVVHRDIKPNNVLVNAQGEVKLLDFGIAKLVQQDTDIATDLTQEFARVLTPANASPEQVLGSNITTRSDVYGLGALLMHLLTDEPIFDSTPSSQSNIESMIVNMQPTRPSVKCMTSKDENIRRRAKVLKGDLDTIVMTALQKEPERRYSSSEHLLEDIVRHQRNYPISAKPDSVAYRVTKFVQRNTLSTVFVSLFLLSLIGTSLVIIQQSITIQEERDAALQQAFVAQETASFMTDMFDAADPNVNLGQPISVKLILDKAARDLKNLNSDPLIIAQLSTTLAKVYNQIGEYDLSTSLIENADTYLAMSMQSAQTKTNVSLKFYLGNEKSNLLLNTGQYKEALALLKSLLNDLKSPLAKELSREQFDDYYIMYEYGLGTANSYSGQDKQAITHYQNAITRSEQVIALKGENAKEQSKHDLPSRYFGLGHSLRRTENFEQSKTVLLRGIEIEKSLDKPPTLDLAHGLNQLADTYLQLGNFELAEKYAQEGLSIRQDIHEYGHVEVIASIGVLSNIYAKQKQYTRSIEMRKEMVKMIEQAVGKEHPYYAAGLHALGNLHMLNDDYESSQTYLTEAYQRFVQLFPEGHKYVLTALVTLGDLALRKNENLLAKETFEKSLALIATINLEPSKLVGQANALYAVALYKNAQATTAIEYEKTALGILASVLGTETPEYQLLIQRIQSAKN